MAESRRSCASCGAPNEEDARFCEGCGTSLARICATCGVEASATARFCRGCGAPLDQTTRMPDSPDAGPVRKTVTVMFADLAGSTSFEERVDAETAREVIGGYHDLLRTVARRHRAGVTKYIGDGFMAVWGVPEIGPEDALRAVDAAVELQERFVDLAARVTEVHSVELALRVAVNTGEVVVGAGDADLVGDALNVCARLESECPRGHVVVGEETWRTSRGHYSYESLGEVQVKGRSAPVAVYQWLGRQSESADAAPFVGRRPELRRLQSAMDGAVAARSARLVTVVGDPGVGKSRIAAEFTGAQTEARVIEARCDLESTVAMAPLIEVLRTTDLENGIPAGIPERERLIRDLGGLAAGEAGSVEENFWALRRFVEVLASEAPVVLVLDDIQWADTLLLDFIEHLVEWSADVPVFVLALARPELRELRPELGTVGRFVSEAVHLSGLDASATAELAANVLGAARLPDELVRRLPSSTGGNPLFVRELVGMLAHDGVLIQDQDSWRLTIDVDAIAVPPTIHALLASRLERLDGADRRVLEIASVVGSEFSIGAVRALAGGSGTGVTLSLNRLRRLELAQPSGAYIGDEPVWRFHHVLIRDVAYRRLLKSDRADLHEKLAAWVESGGPSVAFDSDELVARHLEAAYTYRSQLGAVDDRARELAVRSARHYAVSARRALDRDELVSAGTQAARGAALAAADEALHSDLLLIGCEAFLSAGDVAAGAPLVDELERIADESLAPWATCYRCQYIVYTDPERLLEVETRLHEAIDEFARRTDHAGLAKAHRVRASARGRLGRIGDSEIDLFEALIAARQSGDHRQITAALGAAPGAALWGPSPVPKAGGRCLDVVRMQRMTTAAPSLEATSLRHLAVLELLRGRPDKARTMLADARQVVADLGLRHGVMETELFAGIIESMEGDPVAAEPHFRTALEGLDALGVGADAGQAAALLARSVLAQGRLDEADRHAAESERLAGRNLKTAIAWRAVRAEILATQGRHADAVAMAREAVTVAAGTDLVLDHAEACLALSRVLAAVGDAEGANSARVDAESLYAAKEVTTRAAAEPAVLPSTAVRKEPGSSQLAVTNRASEAGQFLMESLRRRDVEAVAAAYSDTFTYDDRRRISGDPVDGRDAARVAVTRMLSQYSQFHADLLAVRGERLALMSGRWADDSGNEAADLSVLEVDNEGQVIYHGRFDDDFEGAYQELDRRYYSGEGEAFAAGGATLTKYVIALNRGDLGEAFEELAAPDAYIENRSRSVFGDRSTAEFRDSIEELSSIVSSARTWHSAIHWLSPNWVVLRAEREAAGQDGEQYTWSRIYVIEMRDGRAASLCEFEVDDEEAAFAYAGERIRASTSRLRIRNRASEIAETASQALQAHDVDALRVDPSEDFVYDDRRRISGDPIEGAVDLHAATERILESYPHTEWRTMAVRGELLEMHSSRLWDDDGNEAITLNVMEFDDAGRLKYFGRFEEDDFEGAYRELDRRYYAGEGAAFAETGRLGTDWVIAISRGDYAMAFEELSDSAASFENRSRSAFPDPLVSDPQASYEDLSNMVASTRSWPSVFHWLSPNHAVARFEREAVGRGGERYSWTWILVAESRGGRLGSSCLFEIDDEAAAFAYAEERMQADRPRLAVTNQASRTADAYWAAMRSHDVEAALQCCSEGIVYDDRRGITGGPIDGRVALRAAFMRIFDQYTDFESRTLAVRGEHLVLGWSRWSSDAGFQTAYLHVVETGVDGRIVYEARFDEDDFDGATVELDDRYYAGEGAPFAENGIPSGDAPRAIGSDDFDRLFGELMSPDLLVKTRSRRAFPDRSASDLRAGFEELSNLVTSKRVWNAALAWISLTCSVIRLEREATGADGEMYQWSMILVTEHCEGRVTSICEFDPDDEEGAFAYAEEVARAQSSRLAVRNETSETIGGFFEAMRARDAAAAIAFYSEQFVYDDHRRLSGDPVVGRDAMRVGIERHLAQFSQYEFPVWAVRGQSLHLVSSIASDADGNKTSGLTIFEVRNGLIMYHGRFDDDDFEGAYRELERRYYAGEGEPYARYGDILTEAAIALDANDFDLLLGELCAPDMRVENRTRSAFPDRSIIDLRASFGQLNSMVTSMHSWLSAACWVSPEWTVVRLEREALGSGGEQYEWTRVLAIGFRGVQIGSMCQFELEDESAAFDYVEERARATVSRLALNNRASRGSMAVVAALQAHDIDRLMGHISGDLVYDDRRHLGGNPLGDVRDAMSLIMAQYTHFEARTLAVRGENHHLLWSRWTDDAGNETAHLHVQEFDDDGLMLYEGRFDEGDFEGAYRELDRRYYAGEGAEFAEAAAIGTEFAIALDQGDLDRGLGELSAPEMRIENRSRSPLPDRSIAEFRASLEDLNAMLASTRSWNSVVYWISPTCCIIRQEREGVGRDGEQYAWSRLWVGEIRDSLMVSLCQFDVDDEDSAFLYAEERMQAASSRLAVTNRSVQSAEKLGRALNDRDIDEVMNCFSDDLVYDDRRRLTGDPISGRAEFRAAFERILAQYSHFERRILAVRGDRLNLHWGRWSDDSGNETSYLHVYEMDDEGLQIYEGRFDEDDFDSAYRELEGRYYRGEGAAFSAAGNTSTQLVISSNQGDLDQAFGEFMSPEIRLENRSRTGFPDRPKLEFRASSDELMNMFASVRIWNSAVVWLSPTWCVSRLEREAVGHDGEHYLWTLVVASEVTEGLLTSMCEFDLEDEDAAFAYAEEQRRTAASRLAVTNRASERFEAARQAAQALDANAMVDCYVDGFVYDDRRRLGGNPIADLRSAVEGILAQYTHFEGRTLAVRGESLCLSSSRWWNDEGFETSYLIVHAVDDSGRFSYEGRFDGDDFAGAYRELDERYYAGEGSAFAATGATPTEVVIALNLRDFDKVFNELTVPGAPVENRSRLPFPNRSADVLRTSFTELDSMVASTRTWFSAMRWVSNVWGIVRFEREAVGTDGERFAWTHLVVLEIRHGRIASMCEFEVDDEDAAFAYAEQHSDQSASRMAVNNRASEVWNAVGQAMGAHDAERVAAHFDDSFVYDERWALGGSAPTDVAAAIERIFEQYSHFAGRTVAVRGDHLQLATAHWTNDNGFETDYLHVTEINDDGRICYYGRFDANDFVGAYRELDERYYAGEGSAFAEAGAIPTEMLIALNQGDFDKAFGEFIAADAREENRSRLPFPNRSPESMRASFEELDAMVSSARTWFSAMRWLSKVWTVVRFEREAIGKGGEHFTWTLLVVLEIRDGRVMSMCDFELDDEDAAFAYAEDRARAADRRLAVTNMASRTWDELENASRTSDFDRALSCYSESYVFDDRRRFGAIGQTPDIRTALKLIIDQYNRFEARTLAVRGERLHLGWTRWSNDEDYETTYLYVHEVDEDGRWIYEGRFDEDDFEGAYRELTRRYCSGEGLAFAAGVTVGTDWLIAANNRDFDRVFGDLSDADLRIENRSSSAFPDRTATELRASFDALNAMVDSVRMWNSTECWLSPGVVVGRQEREATGRDGEQYAWTRLFVFEAAGGRATGMCEFDLEDEAAAFAYAEERMREG